MVVCVHACVLPRLHECTCVVVRICAELPASAPASEHIIIMSVSFLSSFQAKNQIEAKIESAASDPAFGCEEE